MKRIIKDIFRIFGYHITKFGNTEIMLESFITRYKKYDDKFFFVQIGANNGVRYDPIYRIVNELNLEGLVIEPIEEYYNELVKNYSNNKKVKTVNNAIYSENKELIIYKVKKDVYLPDWVNGIASLNPNHHKKTNIPIDSIVEEKVKGITFDTLIQDHRLTRIDFLQIDTEGYDYNLLKMFPFDKFKPKLINFEHSLNNGIMSYEQYDEIHSMLIKMGYRTIMNINDTICYLE